MGEKSIPRMFALVMKIYTYTLARVNRIAFQKGSFLFCLSLVLFLSSCESIANLGGEPITDIEVNETRRLCKELKVPESFKVRRTSELTKYSTTDFTTQYESDADSLDEINRYFITQLTSQGWENHSYQTGGTVYLDFRKQKYSIDIEYDEFSLTRTRVFGITCSWGIDK